MTSQERAKEKENYQGLDRILFETLEKKVGTEQKPNIRIGSPTNLSLMFLPLYQLLI